MDIPKCHAARVKALEDHTTRGSYTVRRTRASWGLATRSCKGNKKLQEMIKDNLQKNKMKT